ncbi:hypothetical protein ACFL1X_00170 [Candidatus Hydrogenedentota bacterium]
MRKHSGDDEMLSAIEVKCPHCGAMGQVLLPPVGQIIIGPCPMCDELVVLLNGEILALETEIMQGGSVREKREHLMEVLTASLQKKVDEVIGADFSDPEVPAGTPGIRSDAAIENSSAKSPISRTEMRDFVCIDLHLIDSADYFKKFFGK